MAGRMERTRTAALPVAAAHTPWRVEPHCRRTTDDPFDRLLIAQARHEGFKLVSRDAHVPLYGVPHIVA